MAERQVSVEFVFDRSRRAGAGASAYRVLVPERRAAQCKRKMMTTARWSRSRQQQRAG